MKLSLTLAGTGMGTAAKAAPSLSRLSREGRGVGFSFRELADLRMHFNSPSPEWHCMCPAPGPRPLFGFSSCVG